MRNVLVLGLLLSGCAADVDELDRDLGDGIDDVADEADLPAAEGKADRYDLRCAMLEVANTASLEELDDAARLNRRTADAILARRLGEDGTLGTIDDRYVTSLAQLDAIPWVGPVAFTRIALHAIFAGYECATQRVQLLATNDFHGNLQPPQGSSGRIVTGPDPMVNRVDAGGVEFLATHLARLEAENPEQTLVVAAGDVIGATPLLSALFHDEPTVESMGLAGLDIAGVGNHEFDEGPDELLRMQRGGCHPVDGCRDGDGFEGASYDYLAANVIVRERGETLLPPYAIRSFGNARVGFIGLTLEGTPQIVTPAAVSSLDFEDEVETINALVPELRARGVETIVVLLHEGGFTTGLYDACDGISGPVFDIVRALDRAVDVVVSGHTNAAHVCDIDGILVTSAAHYGRLITDIDLVIDERTGDVVSRDVHNRIVTRDVDRDPRQTALIAKYQSLAAPFANRVVGTIGATLARPTVPTPTGETLLGSLISDAQLAATRAPELGGARIAFLNPGGIRADLVEGELTYEELFSVQPFGNSLVTITLTGAQIRALLEQQWTTTTGAARPAPVMLQVSAGFAYTFDATAPLGARVKAITLDDVAIDEAASYRVTVNSFLVSGGDGFTVLRDGTSPLGGAVDLDALEAWIATSPALPTLGRIRN